MTDNPFKTANGTAKQKLTAQEWCDLGNAKLRGEVPHKDGKFYRRDDVEWRVVDGHPVIGWKRCAQSQFS